MYQQIEERAPGGALIGSPTGDAWQVAATLPVSYEVRLCDRLFDPANDTFEREAFGGVSRRRLIIIEQRVHDLFGKDLNHYLEQRGLHARIVCVNADETLKDSVLAHRLIEAIDHFGLDRRDEPVIAVGGGVLLDAAGWAVSVYRRGTPYIRVPTTLIGLVDAGVGVKTAVNHRGQKNIIGSYHVPLRALLDPQFLVTLPARHISNGMAEIAKMGLMCDRYLWDLIAARPAELIASAVGRSDEALREVGREVITRAVHSMLVELQPNLWEKNLDRLVDFGHTLSPSLEMAVLPELLHGEAVSVDMAVCCAVSANRGLLDVGSLTEIVWTLTALGLPVSHPACTRGLLEDGLAHSTRHRGGRQRFAVPVRPGSAVFLDDVTVEELIAAADLVRKIEAGDHAAR